MTRKKKQAKKNHFHFNAKAATDHDPDHRPTLSFLFLLLLPTFLVVGVGGLRKSARLPG
jgi:hypothetical protein